MPRPRWQPTELELRQVEKWASQGLTLEQISWNLGINPATLYKHKRLNTELAESLKKGQSRGVQQISNALFNSALEGNITAQIFFLKCKGGWTEKPELQPEAEQANGPALTVVFQTIDGETVDQDQPFIEATD